MAQSAMNLLTDSSKNTIIVILAGVVCSALAGFVSLQQSQVSGSLQTFIGNNGIVVGAGADMDVYSAVITVNTILSLDNGIDMDLTSVEGSAYNFLDSLVKRTSSNGEKNSFGIDIPLVLIPNAVNVAIKPVTDARVIGLWPSSLFGGDTQGNVEMTNSQFTILYRRTRTSK